jgi:hypothetical protein
LENIITWALISSGAGLIATPCLMPRSRRSLNARGAGVTWAIECRSKRRHERRAEECRVGARQLLAIPILTVLSPGGVRHRKHGEIVQAEMLKLHVIFKGREQLPLVPHMTANDHSGALSSR